MSPLGAKLKATPAKSDNNAGQCPHCKTHLARIAELQARLTQCSDTFSQTVSQIKNSQKAKARVEEMDERFIEQCVRAKVDAETELQEKSHQFAEQIAALKTQALAKINLCAKQIAQMKQQRASLEQKLNELAQKAGKDKSNYQQAINQLKTQAQQKLSAINEQTQKQQLALNDKVKQLEQTIQNLAGQLENQQIQADAIIAEKEKLHRQQLTELKQQHEQNTTQLNAQLGNKLQTQEQELSRIKAALNQANEQISANARKAARAEELNERLLQQCNMAKLGADTEISEKAKEFARQISHLKTDATKKLTAISTENTKIKKAAQNALQKASQRIKTLEHAISCLNATASSIESPDIAVEPIESQQV